MPPKVRISPQKGRSMGTTKRRGPKGQRNVKDGGLFHFLRSPDSERKVMNPETHNQVEVGSLSGSLNRSARRIFKQHYGRFRKRWQKKLKGTKMSRKIRKIRKRNSRSRKASGHEAGLKFAFREMATLATLSSMGPGKSDKIRFHHRDGYYEVRFGQSKKKEHFVELSILGGVADPSYSIGKFVGSPEYIILEIGGMTHVVEAMAAARDRIMTASGDDTDLVNGLIRLASTSPALQDRIMGVFRIAGSSGPLVKLFDLLIRKGAESAGPSTRFPVEESYSLELDAGSYFQEAGKLLEKLSSELFKTSNPYSPKMSKILGLVASNLYHGLVTYGKLRRVIKQEQNKDNF